MIKAHFLNVGQGDCIILEFRDAGRIAVIDINMGGQIDENSQEEMKQALLESLDLRFRINASLMGFGIEKIAERSGFTVSTTNPVDYIQSIASGGIFRFVSTHPHMDHLSGLVALNNALPIRNFWIVKNEFDQERRKLSSDQRADWNLYLQHRDSEPTDDNVTVIRPLANDSRDYYEQDGIQILAPTQELVDLARSQDNRNIMSYVLLIRHGAHKIIIGGDAESDTWEYILDTNQEVIRNTTILKASHHGRDSGYHQKAVEVMNPKYTVVSVGKKPSTDASNKYRQYSDHVWSTRWKGNITFCLDGMNAPEYEVQFDR
jgi:competence protein ComEC